ncbi:hypothetical protein [Streptomyces anandii]|uniref:hypothetical protein n=1 Tax=Streptomyces anandii TaxID=285454 RepID=UPI0036A89D12
MNDEPVRILLLRPDRQVWRAAAEVGLRAWPLTGDDLRSAPVEELLVATARTHRVAHILYFGRSPALHRAVERASRTVFPARARALDRLRDPAVLRRILNQSGVSCVEAVTVTPPDSARTWLENLTLPRVVKTVAEHRVDVVRDADAVARWADGSPPMPCVIEEFLEGPRLIVESFSHEGMHHVVGVTGGAGAAPPGADLLYPAALSQRDAAAVRAVVRAVLDLAGHEEGPVRTDVVLTADGPRVAAVDVPPPVGAAPRLVRAATGRHRETEILLRLAGRPVPRPLAARCAALAHLDDGDREPPRAEAVAALRATEHVHDVRIVEGPHGRGDAEVIVRAASPHAAARRLATVRERWATLCRARR